MEFGGASLSKVTLDDNCYRKKKEGADKLFKEFSPHNS